VVFQPIDAEKKDLGKRIFVRFLLSVLLHLLKFYRSLSGTKYPRELAPLRLPGGTELHVYTPEHTQKYKCIDSVCLSQKLEVLKVYHCVCTTAQCKL
jgi:hypothetical protein